MHDNGLGVPKDSVAANEWYRKAAELGDPNAMHNLGLSYETGSGIEPDKRTAFSWFEKAAQLGHAISQRRVGFILYNGDGVPADPVTALDWYRKAAVQGDVESIANIGLAYRDGQGVQADSVEAYAWLDVARFITQRWQDNMQTKWGIRRELDGLRKTLAPAQVKAAEARTRVLYEKLKSGSLN